MFELTVEVKTIDIEVEDVVDIDAILFDIAEAILTESQRLVNVDPAELADSGHIRQTGSEYEIVYDAPHAIPLEFGAGPHSPPWEVLAKWTWRNRGRFGLSKRKETDRLAWAIKKTIEKKGSDAHPYLRPAADSIRGAKANNIIRRHKKS